MSQDIRENSVESIVKRGGFTHFGWTPISPALSMAQYEAWLDMNYHGEMEYLKKHVSLKKDPEQLVSRARSAIVVAAPYQPHPQPSSRLKSLKIASYARGADYHFWLQEKLESVAEELRKEFKNDVFLCATDSRPVLERDLAYRAGLGWIGKNTCLIDQKRGSFFLIGEIITTVNLPEANLPHPDRCGTCQRCIEACPTQALIGPRLMDARKCISYLTIESKKPPPLELRKEIGGHFFGCDICQDVCPWNQKAVEPSQSSHAEGDLKSGLLGELRWILESSNGTLERELAATPLVRARGFGLKRNAIVVVANLKLVELRDIIARYVTDTRLGELAEWALGELEP